MKNQDESTAEAWDHEFEAPTENLSILLSEAAARYSDHNAINSLHQVKLPNYFENTAGVEGDRSDRLTYRKLHLTSLRLAKAFSFQGVTKGSSVVVVLFNQVEWCLAFWATMHIGCQFVPLDPRAISQPEEASHLIARADPKVLLVATNALAVEVEKILQKEPKQDILRYSACERTAGQLPNGWSTLSDMLENSCNDPDPNMVSDNHYEDPAVMLFTSGTTSSPKACLLTSLNLSAPAVQIEKSFDLTTGHNVCQHLPTFHIFGIAFSLATWLAGATVVFPSPSFNPTTTVQAIQQGVNVHVPCVPLMAQAIADHPSTPPNGFKTLSSITLGGAPSFPRILELCKALAPKKLCVGYGLTEGVVTLINIKDVDSWKLPIEDISSGHACAGARIKICQPGKRVPIGRGQLGEIHQGGLPVFGGYLGVESQSCYREYDTNWVATGDQAYMDEEGYVYILGRYKDVIIRGGENISPAKVEDCLRQAPGVEACVVGVPDEIAGEVPVAVVRQNGDLKLSGDEFKAMVKSDMSPVYTPVLVLNIQEDLSRATFPTTTTGKIQKSVLREWVLEYVKENEPTAHHDSSQPLELQLASIWSFCSGQSFANVDFDTSVHTIADSMVLIHFTSHIRKTLRRIVSTGELLEFNTLAKITHLLESKPQLLDRVELVKPNLDPESVALNMIHAQGQNQRVELTKDQANLHLKPLGLGWNDVEDVLPVTDSMKLMTKGGRKPSWNHRHSMVVQSRSEEEVHDILKLWIERNHLLRTTHLFHDKDFQLYLVMRPNDRWVSLQINSGGELASTQDIATYRLNDTAYDYVDLSGPLVKLTILPISNCNATGLVVHMHHVMFDGVVLRQWYDDLDQLLSGNQLPSDLHPFRDFSLLYQKYRQSQEANEAVDFHVKRLRGIGAVRDNFWPQQRAPHWFKGDDQGWWHKEECVSHQEKRVPLDGPQSCGTMGLCYKVELPFIRLLKSKWELPPPIVAKSACALFNLHTTGAEEAVFVSDEAARVWPCPESDSSVVSPAASPLDISGPTFQKTINRIRMQGSETTLQFLQRVRDGQADIDRYCHAPLDAIFRALEQDPVHGSADVAAARDILQRQLFDWFPSAPPSVNAEVEPANRIEMLEVLSRADLGWNWYPSLLPSDHLLLDVTWDDAQLTTSEVSQAMEAYLCAMKWISDPANLDKPVTDCEFCGQDILTSPVRNFHR